MVVIEEAVVIEAVEVEEKVLGEEAEVVVVSQVLEALAILHTHLQHMILDLDHLMEEVLLTGTLEDVMNHIIDILRMSMIIQEIMAEACHQNLQENVLVVILPLLIWQLEDPMRGVSPVIIPLGGATSIKVEPLQQLGGI